MFLKYCKYEDIFVDTLSEYVQEKSASRVNSLLVRNSSDWKHIIPEGMIGLATCTTTVRNKIALNECPTKTLDVLVKWNCNLTENNYHPIRMILYNFYNLDENIPEENDMMNANFNIIEYFISETTIEIQEFGCRVLDDDDSLLLVSCPKWVDYSIHQSFKKINQLRKTNNDKKLGVLSLLLLNGCNIPKPLNVIISNYLIADYQFKYDTNDYDDVTGGYKY